MCLTVYRLLVPDREFCLLRPTDFLVTLSLETRCLLDLDGSARIGIPDTVGKILGVKTTVPCGTTIKISFVSRKTVDQSFSGKHQFETH